MTLTELQNKVRHLYHPEPVQISNIQQTQNLGFITQEQADWLRQNGYKFCVVGDNEIYAKGLLGWQKVF